MLMRIVTAKEIFVPGVVDICCLNCGVNRLGSQEVAARLPPLLEHVGSLRELLLVLLERGRCAAMMP